MIVIEIVTVEKLKKSLNTNANICDLITNSFNSVLKSNNGSRTPYFRVLRQSSIMSSCTTD